MFSCVAVKDKKRTPPMGKAISDRNLGWETEDQGMVPVNAMSDEHLVRTIDVLRIKIATATLLHGCISLSVLTLRYMEDEANDRGLNRENPNFSQPS